MNYLEEVKQYSLKAASLWGMGERFGGIIIASLTSLLVLFIGKLAFFINNSLGYAFYCIFFIASALIVGCALNAISDKNPSRIVLDKVIGMTIALSGISLKLRYWKLLLAGFITYHLLLLAKPLLLRYKLFRKIEELPYGLEILTNDIIFGTVVNIILRFCKWLLFR